MRDRDGASFRFWLVFKKGFGAPMAMKEKRAG